MHCAERNVKMATTTNINIILSLCLSGLVCRCKCFTSGALRNSDGMAMVTTCRPALHSASQGWGKKLKAGFVALLKAIIFQKNRLHNSGPEKHNRDVRYNKSSCRMQPDRVVSVAVLQKPGEE